MNNINKMPKMISNGKREERKWPSLSELRMIPMMGILTIAKKLGQSDKLMQMMTRRMQAPKQKRQAFAGYQPTAHDVFVCTYAKSGTNWTMQIAHQIAHYGEATFDNIYDLIPWPDMPMPAMDKAKLDDKRPQEHAPTGLRVIKTHLDSDYVPYTPDAKYIVVVRDPKDVFVSSYHFGKGILNPTGVDYDAKSWLEQFTSSHFFFDSWPAHIASFWPWRERHNVLFLTFGEMKDDLRGTCQQVADLMGVSLTEEQLDMAPRKRGVEQKSSFQYMKALDHKFKPRPPAFGKFEMPVMIRSGKRGASGELLNKEQQAQIDAFCQAELNRLGSDIPYTTLFKYVETQKRKLDHLLTS